MKNFEKISLGKAAQWLVKSAREAGINIEGFDHQITNYFKNHVLKRHGDPEKEKLLGQIAINESDFDKIHDIVKNPDHVMIGAKRDGKDMFYYIKKVEDGTVLYLENIVSNKKALISITMFKKKKELSYSKLKNIISMNKRNDISNLKIVSPVGTGSDPSCAKVAAIPT